MSAKSAALSITVTAYASPIGAPDFDAGFAPNGQEIYLTSASVVAFSYDGINDHGRLDSAKLNSSTRATKNQKVWFRVVSGTNPATLVCSSWS